MSRRSAATQRSAVVCVYPVYGEAQNQKQTRRETRMSWMSKSSTNDNPCARRPSNFPRCRAHKVNVNLVGESTALAGRPMTVRRIHQGQRDP